MNVKKKKIEMFTVNLIQNKIFINFARKQLKIKKKVLRFFNFELTVK